MLFRSVAMESRTELGGSRNVRIKLLIDTEGQRVIYAEAGQGFIDLLSEVPVFSVGSMMKVNSSLHGIVGCLGNLLSSIRSFGDVNMQPSKEGNLTKPIFSTLDTGYLLIPPFSAFFACLGCLNVVVGRDLNTCPDCYAQIDCRLMLVSEQESKPSVQKGGCVKEMAYLVADDFEVKPLSTLSVLALLKKNNMKFDWALEEKIVNVDKDEAQKLLNASLHSKTVFTDVFLVESNVIPTQTTPSATVTGIGKRKAGRN